MSLLTIKQAFEVALSAITPSIDTAYSNVDFTPTIGEPHQEIYLLPATPDNTEQGVKNYREQGLVQVNLCYPLNDGEINGLTRAELIRDTFKKGTTLARGGLSINVTTTPTIFPSFKDKERWCIPVRISYLVDIHL
jgi:hypothetical protein